ncbi:MAG: hypothetical protein P9M03_04160 [Candidatus Theseobacter exili]|nr:hypothetical protein [Candidatus Theseobacter exili]
MLRPDPKKSLVFVLIVFLALPAFSAIDKGKRKLSWQVVNDGDYEKDTLTLFGKSALNLPEIKWKHARTDHFVIHYQKTIYARKVARMAEFFYAYIPDDLGGDIKDRVKGRSHIFIFKDKESWDYFKSSVPVTYKWADSFVRSTVMFLQQKPDNSGSAAIFSHEMTHIVFNRFFRKKPALWLNEGLAEWYEKFAYAAFKGTKKSKRAVFSEKYYGYSVKSLINAKIYGLSTTAVKSFYENAKWFVAFLRMNWPESTFSVFIKDCMESGDTNKMLYKYYGSNIQNLEEGFDRFVKKRAKNM